MTIAFPCNSCGNTLKVDDAHVGRQVTCAFCLAVDTVPRNGEERPAPATPPHFDELPPPVATPRIETPPLAKPVPRPVEAAAAFDREPEVARVAPARAPADSPRSAATVRKSARSDVARFYRIFLSTSITLLAMAIVVIASIFLLPGDRPNQMPIAMAAPVKENTTPAPQPPPEPPPQPVPAPAPAPAPPVEIALKPANRSIVLDDKGRASAVASIREEDGVDRHPGMRGITYSVELDASRVYSIAMTSTRMTPSVKVLAANGIDFLPVEVEVDEKTESRVLLTTSKSEVHKIVVSTKSLREVGPFSLRIIDQGRAPTAQVAKLEPIVPVVPKEIPDPPPPPGFRPMPVVPQFGPPPFPPPPLLQPLPQPKAPIAALLVNGKFEANSSIEMDDGVAARSAWRGHSYDVELKAGQRYQIDLISNKFDAYLYLCAANGISVLAQNDDFGDGLNSRIVYTPTISGNFRVIATSLGKKSTGQYTLRIAEIPQVAGVAPLPRPNPIAPNNPPIPNAPALNLQGPNDRIWTGPATALPLVAGKLRAFGEIVPAPPSVLNPNGKTGRMYEVELQGDKTYRIDLKSDELDAILAVLDGNKILAQDDDSGGDLNARLLFAPPATGKYRILATSLNLSMTGKFLLEVVERPRDEPPLAKVQPNEPFSPDPKMRGAPVELVEGNFVDKGRIGPADLVSRTGKRLGKCYEIDLKAGRTYRVAVEFAPSLIDGMRHPPFVFVYDPAIYPSRISGQGAIGSLVTTFAPTKDARYLFAATTLDGRGIGSYTFRVVEEDRLAANDPLRDAKRTSPPLSPPIAIAKADPAVPAMPFVPGPKAAAPAKGPVAGRIEAGKFEVRGSFEMKSASADFPTREGITYEIEMREDKRYRIEATVPQGMVGVMVYETAPGRFSDGVTPKSFRYTFSPRKTATYRLMVHQAKTDPAVPFELIVTEEPRDAPPPPIVPREITPVMPKYSPAAAPAQIKLANGKFEEKGKFARTDRIYTINTRCGKTFELELTANRTYRLELEFDPEIVKTPSMSPRIIVYPNAPGSAGLATTKQPNDSSVLMPFTPTATDRYVIVVTSYGGLTPAEFTFRVIEEK